MKKQTETINKKSINKNTFQDDVIKGLSTTKKHLDSKYFYDAKGDKLFQKIMSCPEYYLTNCELEILRQQAAAIITTCQKQMPKFDVVELGAGDASKSIYLLESLAKRQEKLHYYPIDISPNIIAHLERFIPAKIAGAAVEGMTGEYLEMLSSLKRKLPSNKLVLFLGSSIGNMNPEKAASFLKKVNQLLNPGDLLLIGFDLVKESGIILDAYNDHSGYTKAFNLNLLSRINNELNGNFKLNQFSHYPTYDTNTGACKSYLISLTDQTVEIAGHIFSFQRQESILMEISQKFDPKTIQKLATHSGFYPVAQFHDSKKWFVDTLWKA